MEQGMVMVRLLFHMSVCRSNVTHGHIEARIRLFDLFIFIILEAAVLSMLRV
jgi:hypothetical protein